MLKTALASALPELQEGDGGGGGAETQEFPEAHSVLACLAYTVEKQQRDTI